MNDLGPSFDPLKWVLVQHGVLSKACFVALLHNFKTVFTFSTSLLVRE